MTLVDPGQNLRKFHNLIKKELVSNYIAPKSKQVVDVGSGMMGDRDKLEKIGTLLTTCLELNPEFIQEGKKRTAENKYTKFKWFQVDLSSTQGFCDLIKDNIVAIPESVSSFSSQFSLGQIVSTKSHLLELIKWIASFLVSGGTWIGTIMDDTKIDALLDGKSIYRGESMFLSTTNNSESLGDFRRITIEMPHSKTAIKLQESLIPWKLIVESAQACGLKLIHSETFDKWKSLFLDIELSKTDEPLSFSNRSFAFYKCHSIGIESGV